MDIAVGMKEEELRTREAEMGGGEESPRAPGARSGELPAPTPAKKVPLAFSVDAIMSSSRGPSSSSNSSSSQPRVSERLSPQYLPLPHLHPPHPRAGGPHLSPTHTIHHHRLPRGDIVVPQPHKTFSVDGLLMKEAVLPPHSLPLPRGAPGADYPGAISPGNTHGKAESLTPRDTESRLSEGEGDERPDSSCGSDRDSDSLSPGRSGVSPDPAGPHPFLAAAAAEVGGPRWGMAPFPWLGSSGMQVTPPSKYIHVHARNLYIYHQLFDQ